MGCVFCESGRRGFVRDLRPEEIVGQYAAARLTLGWDIGQIVFMGMGEPLDNFEGLAGALAVFLDESGPAFSQDDLTVCTLGLPDGIARLRGLGLKRLNLSVSLNAPDEGLRGELMPATRGVGLEALAAVLALYPQRRNFALAVNYCLIPGRNDGEGAAEGVAAFLRAAAPSGRVVLNLIPYNPGPSPIGRAPTEAEIESFTKRLEAAGATGQAAKPPGPGPHGGLRAARARRLAAAAGLFQLAGAQELDERGRELRLGERGHVVPALDDLELAAAEQLSDSRNPCPSHNADSFPPWMNRTGALHFLSCFRVTSSFGKLRPAAANALTSLPSNMILGDRVSPGPRSASACPAASPR